MFFWAPVHSLQVRTAAGLRSPCQGQSAVGSEKMDWMAPRCSCSRPLFPSSHTVHVVRPHGINPLSSSVVWSPVWEREPAGDNSSTTLKLQLQLPLQLQHLWRTTAEEMTPRSPAIQTHHFRQTQEDTVTAVARTSSRTNYKMTYFSRCRLWIPGFQTKIMIWQ